MHLGIYTPGKDASNIHINCHKYQGAARKWNYREIMSFCGIIVSFHIHFSLFVSS